MPATTNAKDEKYRSDRKVCKHSEHLWLEIEAIHRYLVVTERAAFFSQYSADLRNIFLLCGIH
jgi:hypothetical protein